jgi:glucose-6-phosphate 1-epimerase
VLTHPKGPSTEILLFGATVISWKSGSAQSSEPVERLFVSKKAALDGSKAVRGGIPVVFPCFGAPTHAEHSRLSQHGFARNEVWTYDSVVMDTDIGVSVRLRLEPSEKVKAVYDRQFELIYVVSLAEHQLSTDLHVKNNSSGPLEFQALFHTYIRAPSSQVSISPLNGLQYFDKTESDEKAKETAKTETRSGVNVLKFTDSIYQDAPQEYKVQWPGGGLEVRSKELKDVVVWNPQAEAGGKLADMEEGGWEHFVCVEPGHVRGFKTVAPGEKWIGQQTLTVLPKPANL